jgi:hypothetical protein
MLCLNGFTALSVCNSFVVKSSDLLAGKAAPETGVAAGPPAPSSPLEATLVAPTVSVPTHRCLPTAIKKLSIFCTFDLSVASYLLISL